MLRENRASTFRRESFPQLTILRNDVSGEARDGFNEEKMFDRKNRAVERYYHNDYGTDTLKLLQSFLEAFVPRICANWEAVDVRRSCISGYVNSISGQSL